MFARLFYAIILKIDFGIEFFYMFKKNSIQQNQNLNSKSLAKTFII